MSDEEVNPKGKSLPQSVVHFYSHQVVLYYLHSSRYTQTYINIPGFWLTNDKSTPTKCDESSPNLSPHLVHEPFPSFSLFLIQI